MWDTSAAGVSDELGIGIATDPRGSGYVTGVFEDTATFGADEANETVLTARAASTCSWRSMRRTAPSCGPRAPAGRANDSAQHRDGPPRQQLRDRPFAGTATFGAGEANETVLTAAGGPDVFVAKYARDGTLLWATSASGGDPTGATTSRRTHAATAT